MFQRFVRIVGIKENGPIFESYKIRHVAVIRFRAIESRFLIARVIQIVLVDARDVSVQ